MTRDDIVAPPRPRLDEVDFQVTKAKVRSALLQRGSPATRVARFEIVGRAGAGAMGRVLVGHDPDLDREVAVKLIGVHAAEPAAIEHLRERLLREARALASLSHPNVVTVHEVGVSDGDVYIAMEYVRGTTLRQWATPPRAWREVVDVFVQAGQGLAAAHAKGLVHRDFKPDNVLVGDDGRVRVADFGLARGPGPSEESAPSLDDPSARREGSSDSLTQAGARLGTPGYRAPELQQGHPASAASDQYAFCVSLYEALHGHRPRPPGSDPPGPAPGLPRWLGRLLARGLAHEPSERYPAMDPLVAELRRPRVRRRRTIVGLVAVAGLGATAALASVALIGDDRCAGLGHQLDGVWDEATRASLLARFAAEDKAYARDLGDKIVPGLSDHAERWVAQRVEACEATRVRGEQGEAALALRIACLDERRAELDATVDALSGAEALRDGPTLVSALRPPEGCGVAIVGAGVEAPPAAIDDEVEGIRAELARVRVQERLGQPKAAVDVARELLRRAERLGFGPLVAEAESQLGRILARLDDEAAERTLRDAIWRAEAGRMDELAADAWLHLAAWSIERESEPSRTAPLLERASAAVSRLGDEGLRRARLHALAGRLATAAARYDDAGTELQAAAAILRERDPEGPAHADVLDALGAVHFHRGDYEAALRVNEQATALSERIFGPAHPRVADRLQNVATVLVASQRPAAAIPMFERARAILEDAYGPEHGKLSAVLNGLGAACESVGRLDDAAEHYQRALAIATLKRGSEHPALISPLVNLGRILPRLDRVADGEAHLVRALSIAEAAYGPDHPRVAEPLTSLGQLRYARGDGHGAAQVHARALEIRRATLGAHALATAISEHNLGDALILAERPAEGLRHLDAAREVFAAQLPPEHPYRRANDEARARAHEPPAPLADEPEPRP